MSWILLQVVLANAVTRAAALWGALRLSDRATAWGGGACLGAAAGLLLTFAATHLLPEAFEHPAADPHVVGLVLGATLLFFFALGVCGAGHNHAHPGALSDAHPPHGDCGHDHHDHHDHDRQPGRARTRAAAVLLGGTVHSFVDGLLVAAAFWMGDREGWMVALAVLAHELPQQTGYLIILRAAGVERARAVLLCAMTAVAAVLGGVAGLSALHWAEELLPYALMVSAASFLFITLYGLLPELLEGAHGRGAKTRAVLSVAAGVILSLVLLGPGHDHDHPGHVHAPGAAVEMHDHAHDHEHDHGHDHAHAHAEDHDHDHAHDHDHDHEHEDGHDHAAHDGDEAKPD